MTFNVLIICVEKYRFSGIQPVTHSLPFRLSGFQVFKFQSNKKLKLLKGKLLESLFFTAFQFSAFVAEIVNPKTELKLQGT